MKKLKQSRAASFVAVAIVYIPAIIVGGALRCRWFAPHRVRGFL